MNHRRTSALCLCASLLVTAPACSGGGGGTTEGSSGSSGDPGTSSGGGTSGTTTGEPGPTSTDASGSTGSGSTSTGSPTTGTSGSGTSGTTDPGTGTSGTTDPGTSSGTSSTTGGAPVCGDGVVEPPEMCEPGEPDCQADCTYPQGLVFWTDIIVGLQPNPSARVWGVAFDPDDAPLAAMQRYGTAVKKYTRQGDEVWWQLWTNDMWPSKLAYDIAARPDGSQVMVGQAVDPQTGNDGFVMQMSADGESGWGLQFELEHNDWLSSVVALPDGSTVAAGARNQDPVLDDRGFIVRISADGAELWRDEFSAPMTPSALAGVTLLADGRIVTFGCCLAGGDFLLRAYELDGSVGWTTALPALKDLGFGPRALTVDRNGDVVVAWSTVNDEFWLGKYDSEGAELWTKIADEPELAWSWPQALVATPQGRYFFGGHRLGEGIELFYGSFDEEGDLLWTDAVTADKEHPNQVHDVAVDSRGLVLLGGLIREGEFKGLVRMLAP